MSYFLHTSLLFFSSLDVVFVHAVLYRSLELCAVLMQLGLKPFRKQLPQIKIDTVLMNLTKCHFKVFSSARQQQNLVIPRSSGKDYGTTLFFL